MSKIDLIFNWNKNSIHNNHNTIQEVIKDWEQHYLCDFTTDSEEKAIINGLYDMYIHEWDDERTRGQDFLEDNKIDYELIRAIEDAYNCYKKDYGLIGTNDLLENKLNYIFLRHAEVEMENAIKYHNLDVDLWGGN